MTLARIAAGEWRPAETRGSLIRIAKLCAVLSLLCWVSCWSASPATAATPTSGWVLQSPASSPPSAFDASMAFDQATGTAVLFGGFNSPNDLGQTWIWDGTSWTEKFPTNSPSPRNSASMAYDAATGQLLLFGGYFNDPITGNQIYYNDTWMWTGTTWIELSPADRPGGSIAASMAYDAATHTVVLFGGTGASQNETWSWNGTNWTELFPTTTPPGRHSAVMDYDPSTKQIVMFGGLSDDFAELGDTWTWDGTNWTQRSPSTSPSPREAASMAYYPATSTEILFGGLTNSAVLNDTWSWDGSTWTKQSPASSPPPIHSASMVTDSVTGDLVLVLDPSLTTMGGPTDYTYIYQQLVSVAALVTGSQTYGSTGPSFTTTTSAPPGDSFSGTLKCTTLNSGTPISATLAASSYTIDGSTCSGLSLTGPTAAQYTISYTGTTFTVGPASLTVNAPSASAYYGAVPTSFTPAYAGLANGDAAPSKPAVCTTPAVDSSPPGQYTIICSGAIDSNYSISYGLAGVLTITKATTQQAAAPAKVAVRTISFAATLTRGDNAAAVAGKTVVFSVRGHKVCQATTSSTGVASCSIAHTLHQASYTASYAGDADYLSSSAIGTLG